MRLPVIFATLAFMALPAFAEPVALARVSFSADFQEKLEDKLGVREGATLEAEINDALTRELARTGASVAESAPVTIETTIIDARANKPTFEETVQNVSLSYGGSVSTGGAELTGVVRGADGREIARVSHRYYQNDVAFASFTTWGDAERAINGYARKVAAAYRDAAS
ncbi:MAG: hypothetical protein ABW199_02440 [Caulobacterales bacterium]